MVIENGMWIPLERQIEKGSLKPPFTAVISERVFLEHPTERMSNSLSFELMLVKKALGKRGYAYDETEFHELSRSTNFPVNHKEVGVVLRVTGKR